MSSLEEQPKNKQIMAKFKKAKEKRAMKDPVWKELDDFDRGQQWGSDNAAPWIPKPVTNYVHLVKSTKRAAFAIENPIGQLRPLSSADEDAIRYFQKVYEFEWKRVKARKFVREALETGKLLGTGIVQVYYDGDEIGGGTDTLHEGEVKMKHIDPLNKAA